MSGQFPPDRRTQDQERAAVRPLRLTRRRTGLVERRRAAGRVRSHRGDEPLALVLDLLGAGVHRLDQIAVILGAQNGAKSDGHVLRVLRPNGQVAESSNFWALMRCWPTATKTSRHQLLERPAHGGWPAGMKVRVLGFTGSGAKAKRCGGGRNQASLNRSQPTAHPLFRKRGHRSAVAPSRARRDRPVSAGRRSVYVSVAVPSTVGDSISTRWGFRSSGLGTRTSSTPSVNSAATASASTPRGRERTARTIRRFARRGDNPRPPPDPPRGARLRSSRRCP